MLDERKDILIKDAYILTMDGEGRTYPRGDLLIRDGIISGVGDLAGENVEGCQVIDGKDRVVLPGFVNAHCHLQQYFRGVYELIGEFFTVNLPLEGYRRPDDMEMLGLASCAEFIYGGCTTI
ncbi:MAG: hypothetical protein JRH07_13105, partial [Deltaproteobacteria bacterium]|nr:hypothetical protein [Deltaproteobacteria bacterium]